MDVEQRYVQLTLEEALAKVGREALRPDFSGPPVFKPRIGIAKSPFDQRDRILSFLGCGPLPAGFRSNRKLRKRFLARKRERA